MLRYISRRKRTPLQKIVDPLANKIMHNAVFFYLLFFIVAVPGRWCEEVKDRVVDPAKEPWSERPQNMNAAISKQAEDGRVILSFSNLAFCKFSANLATQFRTLGVRHFIFLAIDERAEVCLNQHVGRAHVASLRGVTHYSSGAIAFVEGNYAQMTVEKPRVIANILREGFDVLLTDADVSWLEDPRDLFLSREEADLEIMVDNLVGNCATDRSYLATECADVGNTGFYLARNTSNTIKLMKLIVDTYDYNVGENKKDWHDQAILQEILSVGSYNPGLADDELQSHLKIHYLPIPDAAVGRYFYPGREEWMSIFEFHRPRVVHANFVVGLSKKEEIYSKHNLWAMREAQLQKISQDIEHLQSMPDSIIEWLLDTQKHAPHAPSILQVVTCLDEIDLLY